MSNNKKTVQPKIVSPIFVTPRLVEPKAIKIPLGGKSSPQSIDPTWLYFTLPEGGTVSLTKNGNPTAVVLEYSLDNGSTWTEWTESGGVRTLTLTEGQTMHVRNHSSTSTGFSKSSSNYYKFSFIADCEVGGNINSLLCSDPTIATLSNYCYSRLFYESSSLTMSDMFTMPSTALANNCYNSMFYKCSSLTMNDTFALPATTLAEYCYYNMFYKCTSLTMNDTFALPATTLAEYCYYNMFNGCTNVNVIRTLMTDISASNCLLSWLNNVSSAGDFYCSQNITIPSGASGIPNGWTRHDI